MRYKMMQESNAKPSAEGPTMCNDSAVKRQIKFSSDLLKGGKKKQPSLCVLTDELFFSYYHLEERSESHC